MEMFEPMVNMLIPAIIKIEPKRNITITPGKIGARETVSTKTMAQIGKTDESDSLSEPRSSLIFQFPSFNKDMQARP
jgi:hypothetical protein